MHDFGEFIYLDVQKTGSTFISNFLELNSSLMPISHVKHGRILQKKPAFYFISSRDPVSQYASLYKFGCEGRGLLYKKLRSQNYANLYDKDYSKFEDWLKFILTPNNSIFLDDGYKSNFARLFGLLSFRFLVLSFPRPIRHLETVNSFGALCDLYDSKRLHSFVIRHEKLNCDLETLITRHLSKYMIEPNLAIDSLESLKPLNQTRTVDLDICRDTRSLIYERERFLYAMIQSDPS